MFVRLFQINRFLWSAINRARRLGWRSEWPATWALSALVHAVVLGLLALITLSNPRTPELIAVLAELAVPEPVVQIDLPSLFPQIDPTTRGLSAGGRPGTAGAVAAGIETAPDHAARQVVTPSSAGRPLSMLDFEPRLPPKGELVESSLGTKLGKGIASGGGFGGGVGNGDGNGSGRQFFELSTSGTKFVYVIDGSGSMTEPHKEARSKLERVKIELARSIGGLPVEMQFYVIFFNKNAVPMRAGSLQPATLDNKRKHLEWVAKIQGGGSTDPREALKLALGLQPDVIYLLTDGVFDPKVAAEVTKLNTRKVSIHTFCFGNDSGESLLQNIAQKNNGTYQFVP